MGGPQAFIVPHPLELLVLGFFYIWQWGAAVVSGATLGSCPVCLLEAGDSPADIKAAGPPTLYCTAKIEESS